MSKQKFGDVIKIKDEKLIEALDNNHQKLLDIQSLIEHLSYLFRKNRERAWKLIKEKHPEVEGWQCQYNHNEKEVTFQYKAD